eukprot:EG_transcript_22056
MADGEDLYKQMEEAETYQQDLVRRIEARRQQNQVMEEQLTANDNENRDVYDRLVLQEEENERLRRDIDAERTERQALFERLEALQSENPFHHEGATHEVMVEFPNLHPAGSSAVSALSATGPRLALPPAQSLGGFPTRGAGAASPGVGVGRVLGIEYREVGAAPTAPLAIAAPPQHSPASTIGGRRILGIEYREVGSASASAVRLPPGTSVPATSLPLSYRSEPHPLPPAASVGRAVATF